VVGGLGALAGADFLQHLIRATATDPERYAVVFEQQNFRRRPAANRSSLRSDRPQATRVLSDSPPRDARRRCDFVALLHQPNLPARDCPNIGTPILGIMDALRAKLVTDHPGVKRIGVLTSDYVREKRLFDSTFGGSHTVIYPDDAGQHALMESVYSTSGIKAGRDTPELLEALRGICAELIAEGSETIIPGFRRKSGVHRGLVPRRLAQGHCPSSETGRRGCRAGLHGSSAAISAVDRLRCGWVAHRVAGSDPVAGYRLCSACTGVPDGIGVIAAVILTGGGRRDIDEKGQEIRIGSAPNI
jgi:aspartate/glutamate racemase